MKNSKFGQFLKKNGAVMFSICGILAVAFAVMLIVNGSIKESEQEQRFGIDLNEGAEENDLARENAQDGMPEGGMPEGGMASSDTGKTNENDGVNKAGADGIKEGRTKAAEGMQTADESNTGTPNGAKAADGSNTGTANGLKTADEGSADSPNGTKTADGSNTGTPNGTKVADGSSADSANGMQTADGSSADSANGMQTADGSNAGKTNTGAAIGTELADAGDTEFVDEAGSIGEAEAVSSASSSLEPPSAEDLFFEEGMGISWPVEGDIVLNYSDDHLIYHPTLEQFRTHSAIAIAADAGTEVHAAADGVIYAIENSAQTGVTVTMSIGNDYYLVYGQLEESDRKVGDRVTQGEVLGTVAKASRFYSEEGDNLYFQVRCGEETLNPMSLLGLSAEERTDDMDIVSEE